MFKNVKINSKQIMSFLSSRTYCTALTNLENKIQQTTIDPKEVQHFKKFGNIWWEKMFGLITLNDLRIPFIRDSLINTGEINQKYVNTTMPFKDLNILDVGCGVGVLTEGLTLEGANMTGVDATEDLIKYAKIHARENKSLNKEIKYIYTSIEDMVPYYKNKFDVVITSECAEHVSNVDTFVKACVEVLKPGGSIFLTTVNKTIPAWLLYIVYDEYIKKLIAKGTHHYEKFIPPKNITNLLVNSNCDILQLKGFTHNRNMGQWYWTRHTLINYAIHAVKRN